MKCVSYHHKTDSFEVCSAAEPVAKGFDVVVKVDACGLNPVDSKINLWFGATPDVEGPWVPGLDVSGRIVAVGDAATDWKVGDRVLYHGNMFRPFGGFAEYAVQDSRAMVSHPEIGSVEAASTPCAGWTAWRALVDKLKIDGRRSIFIAGGAGGVGSYAIQIARQFGVETIVATASAKNHAYLKRLGATHTLDYHTEDIPARVDEITGSRGVSVALDAVGGENALVCASVLGFEGEMVELVDVVEPATYPDAFDKGLSFHQLSLGSAHRYGEEAKANLVKAGEGLSKLVEAGEVVMPEMKVIGLDEVGPALKEIRKQRTVGKIVMQNM